MNHRIPWGTRKNWNTQMLLDETTGEIGPRHLLQEKQFKACKDNNIPVFIQTNNGVPEDQLALILKSAFNGIEYQEAADVFHGGSRYDHNSKYKGMSKQTLVTYIASAVDYFRSLEDKQNEEDLGMCKQTLSYISSAVDYFRVTNDEEDLKVKLNLGVLEGDELPRVSGKPKKITNINQTPLARDYRRAMLWSLKKPSDLREEQIAFAEKYLLRVMERLELGKDEEHRRDLIKKFIRNSYV